MDSGRWSGSQICTVAFQPGQTATNTMVVPLGADGGAAITMHGSGSTDVTINVLGYYTAQVSNPGAGDTYVPLNQQQVLADTRISTTEVAQGKIAAGKTMTLQVAGQVGVPAGAVGVVGYIGTADASQAGNVSIWSGTSDPNLREISYQSGEVDRNLYVGNLSSSGSLNFTNEGAAAVDMIFSVSGYLISPSDTAAGSTFQDIADSDILPATSIAANGSITFAVSGVGGVPATGVEATTQTISATSPSSSGYLDVFPAGTTDPATPVLNFKAGDGQDDDMSEAVLGTSASGNETIVNHSSGTVTVRVSARGYLALPTAPLAPVDASASFSGTSGTVTWSAPDSDGGAAITSYSVALTDQTTGATLPTTTANGNAYSATVSNLNPSDTYNVTVTAVNAVGVGEPQQARLSPTASTNPTQGYMDLTADFSTDIDADQIVLDDSSETDAQTNSAGTWTTNSTTSGVATVSSAQTFTPAAQLATPQATQSSQCNESSSGGASPEYIGSAEAQKHVDSENWMDYTMQIWAVPNARFVNSSQTEDSEEITCTTGGAYKGNGDFVDFSGAATTAHTTSQYLRVFSGGRGATTTANASSHEPFQLDSGSAAVYGNASVTPGLGTGGLHVNGGADGQFPNYPSSLNQYNGNRVNAYWSAPNAAHDAYQADYEEGNTDAARYEWPKRDGLVGFSIRAHYHWSS